MDWNLVDLIILGQGCDLWYSIQLPKPIRLKTRGFISVYTWSELKSNQIYLIDISHITHNQDRQRKWIEVVKKKIRQA